MKKKDKMKMKEEKYGKKIQINKYMRKIRKINQKKIKIKFLIIMLLLMKTMNVVKMESVVFAKEFIQ